MKKFKEFFVNSFLFYLAIELLEEILEDLIAVGISSILMKFVSTFVVTTTTYGGKVMFKYIVKQLTYKEGNDKLEKIKKFFQWIWSNKKTLLGIGASAVTVVSGAGVIDVSSFPELLVGGFNITPLIYYALLAVLVLIGVCGKGFESIKEFAERIGLIKKQKEEKAIIKEAEKELKNEEKLANQTQAQQEKAAAKEKADAEAKAQQEKAEAEHKAKVEAAKAKLKADAEAKAKAEAEKVTKTTTDKTTNA